MKKVFIPILLFLVAFQLEAQQENKSNVNWLSIEEAVKLNKENPKPILIGVYTTWCGFCKKMDAITYNNKTIAEYINKNFYTVKLDAEQKEDIVFKDYTFKYKAYGNKGYNEFAAALLDGKLSYPTTVFMNDKLQLLQSIPGYLEPKLMEQITAYFATKKNQTEKWEDFVKNFKSNL